MLAITFSLEMSQKSGDVTKSFNVLALCINNLSDAGAADWFCEKKVDFCLLN
jgi:hypothetical protein